MSKLRILLVEDVHELREATTEILQAYGYQVIAAENGADGIKFAKAHAVDAAVIDLGLPDMSGHEVAKALKHLPLAILTGNAESTVVPEARVVLKKPLRRGELLEGMKRLLASPDKVQYGA